MRNLISSLFLLVAITFGFSQSIEQRSTALSLNFQKHLSISAEQTKKIETVIKAKLNLISEIGKSEDQEKAKVTIMLEKRKYFSEIKAVLTEEQFNAWQVLRSEQSAALNNNQLVQFPVVDADLDTIIKK